MADYKLTGTPLKAATNEDAQISMRCNEDEAFNLVKVSGGIPPTGQVNSYSHR